MTHRPPVWTTRLATPGATAFAVLSGLEALSRAVIAAALPIQTQALFGNDESVSALSLIGSVAALSIALLIPGLSVLVGRARLCAGGILLLVIASALFMLQLVSAQVLGFAARAVGTAIFYAVISMYIMDHVRRDQIGRSEPRRLLFVGLAWTIGPIAGVQIEAVWGAWAPFATSAAAALILAGLFLALRFSNAPAIGSETRRGQTVSWVQVRIFMAQPRLMLAWLHAVGRGFVWGTFNLYTPLYAVEIGLGPKVGGMLVGIGSGFMLAMPLWGWLARRFGIRAVSLVCFPLASLGMIASGVLVASPWLAVGCLVTATLAMSVIDGYGNALFLRACKPSQRTAMTPIFSTQRDFAEIGNAAIFVVLLIFLPVQVVFITAGLVLVGLTFLATRINRRL
ncbi:MAG: MFS transporter [Hyphomicrobiales bacterium]|nr:MFS transporter [Hyphomicrobiales bacterium]